MSNNKNTANDYIWQCCEEKYIKVVVTHNHL